MTEPVCTVCERPLEDGTPVQYDLAGDGTHARCLPEHDEGDDDRD